MPYVAYLGSPDASPRRLLLPLGARDHMRDRSVAAIEPTRTERPARCSRVLEFGSRGADTVAAPNFCWPPPLPTRARAASKLLTASAAARAFFQVSCACVGVPGNVRKHAASFDLATERDPQALAQIAIADECLGTA